MAPLSGTAIVQDVVGTKVAFKDRKQYSMSAVLSP